jgi:DNA-binding FadR family transcriptional regulator
MGAIFVAVSRRIAQEPVGSQVEKLWTGMQRPTELKLSERYKASRNAIGDAIKWLTVHGLPVETRPRTKVRDRQLAAGGGQGAPGPVRASQA